MNQINNQEKNEISLKISRELVEKRVYEALEMAEEYSEGRIVIQLLPDDDDLMVSHQLGSSWESMGLNANESENRIMKIYDCRDYEIQYWEDSQDRFYPHDDEGNIEEIDDVMTEIERYVLSNAPENSEIVY